MSLSSALYIVGHSNRTLDELMELLKTYGVEILVDVRAKPVSEQFPLDEHDHFTHQLDDRLRRDAVEPIYDRKLQNKALH